MQISIAQIIALGLAASNAVHGQQISRNTGVVRRAAGHALMAFAVPALAAPVDINLDTIIRQQVHRGVPVAFKRQDDGEADDAADDAQDAADDAADQADDAQDDADDAADGADDDADDAADDADDAADDADDTQDDAGDDADDAADDADDAQDDADDDADDADDEADDQADGASAYPTGIPHV